MIVQASAYLKYVGDITVYFDRDGKVASWQGEPIFLDADIVPDPEVIQAIQPWKKIVDKIGLRPLAVSKVPLSRFGCESGECNFGNVIADAISSYYMRRNFTGTDEWTESAISLVYAGGIRAGLSKGRE